MSQVRSLNRVILVGRVGRDPEMTVLPKSGQQKAKFGLATDEGYYDKSTNAWKDLPTQWHNIVAWGPQAQKAERSVHKGDMLIIEGRISTRKYQDKSGQDRWITEIQADSITVLDRNKEGSSGAGSSYAGERHAGRDSFPEMGGAGTPPFESAREGDDPGLEEDPF